MASLCASDRHLANFILEQVVTCFVEQIKQGTVPQVPGWTSRRPMFPRNVANGARYRAFNLLLLWEAACMKGFKTHLRVTSDEIPAPGVWRRRGEGPNLAMHSHPGLGPHGPSLAGRRLPPPAPATGRRATAHYLLVARR